MFVTLLLNFDSVCVEALRLNEITFETLYHIQMLQFGIKLSGFYPQSRGKDTFRLS